MAITQPSTDAISEPARRPVRFLLHVAEVAQPLHQVLFVLRAAGALGRVL